MGKRQRREYIGSELAIRDMLLNLIQGRFKWTNLPERLTSEQLERFICLWDAAGLAVGFSDPVGGAMILPGYPSGEFDVYWLPRSYTVTGANFDRVIPADDCVRFYNDASRHGLLALLDETDLQMSRAWSTMAFNLEQQRNPYVFAGTKEEIASLSEAARRRGEYEGIIAVTASTMDVIETAKRFFPTRPEFIGRELIEQYNQILNRFLTALGFDNLPVQKRERLVTGETTSNNQLIMYFRDSATRQREMAAEEFNRRYGTNINVVWSGGEMTYEIRSVFESGIPGI